MKTITFYSYKGGVGRSLALANVANRLSEFGKRVCILDFDLEAPGLHVKFNDFLESEVKRGIVDYIHSYTTAQIIPKDIDQYVTWVYSKRSVHREPIAMIPAGDVKSHEYWSKVCSIDWKKLFYEQDSSGVEFFFNLKEQIRKQLKPDFLLIDSRTGITDISGVTMSIMADEVVLLAANNRENLDGITQIIKTLLVPENSIQGKVPKINFVLSRIPYFSDPKDKPKEANAKESALFKINKSLADDGFENSQLKKVLVIHSDPELELKESFKIGRHLEMDNQNNEKSVIGIDYLDLFEEITYGMITASERKAYEKFIKVELLIQKARAATSPTAAINLLRQAIELDPKSVNAYAELGSANYNIGRYEEAIENFQMAEKLENRPARKYLWYVGLSYHHLKMYNEALNVYNNVLALLPNEPSVLNNIAEIYYSLQEYDKALSYSKMATEVAPNSHEAWNQYANVLRMMGQTDEAFEAIYTALQFNPQSMYANCTLAEIYAALGNQREFFKNLELSFSFGLDAEFFQVVLEEEPVYNAYFNNDRFLKILEKYNIEIDWEAVLSANPAK